MIQFKLTIQSVLKTGQLYNANNIDPYIPEWWALETLAILEEEMVASKLVNRDFEKYFNKFGDVVNTRRPREFTAIRKVKGDAVTVQDAIADNTQIRLDQWNHVSFFIDDIEEVMSMKKLSDEYARPAAMALARQVDRVVLGQYPRFLGNVAGKLNGITTSNIKDYLIDLRQVQDDTKCYAEGRNLILTSKTEGDILRPEFLFSAEKRGDADGVRKASIGHKMGYDFYKDLNMANIAVGNTTRTFQINLTAGYNVGDTALVVDTGTGEITVGTWVSIDGLPYQVSARTGTAPTTAITLSRGLKRAAADNLPVYVYTPGAVNNASGYAQYYSKDINVDGFSVAPRVGQLVSFGTDTTNVYTILSASTTSITLDRGLEAAIADNDTVNIGPAGAYNLAIHQDAITLAIRGLEPVRSGAGALSTTKSYNGLSMRVTVSYNAQYQRHMWTFDFLSGIQVLDTNLGAVLCG